MSNAAYIELPSSKTRGHVCKFLLITPQLLTACKESSRSSHLCGLDYTILHATPESSSVVARIMHVTGRRAMLLRRIAIKHVLNMVKLRLLAGTRVNSRHLATLHGCLLNYQLKGPCSACDCNQVGSSDNDIGCEKGFSPKEGLIVPVYPDEQSRLERIWCMHHKQVWARSVTSPMTHTGLP